MRKPVFEFNVWAGLEALFGKKEDRPVTQKLCIRISKWIDNISYDEVKALYDSRCDAVHGRWLEDAKIISSIEKSVSLLREALIKGIEQKQKTLPD